MDLKCLMYTAPAEHPQENMRMLGITYKRAEPQPIADQWMFFDCENVPDSLPEHIVEVAKESTQPNAKT